MTEFEIIKALEYCGDENNCVECPLAGTRFEFDMSCEHELMKASAELIKSLKAEKEVLISGQEILLKHISSQNEEIDELQHKLFETKIDIAKALQMIKETKHEFGKLFKRNGR